MVTFANFPILWVSKIKTDISLYTIHSKCVALSHSIRLILPLKSLIKEVIDNLGIDIDKLGSLDDSTQEGRTTAAPLVPPDNWGAQDIQDRLPEEKPTTVPGGGLPGGVCDTSGDAGALRAPARPRHRGHIGGGQPPPTTVPPVRPPGLQEGAHWAPPGDKPVQNGGGATRRSSDLRPSFQRSGRTVVDRKSVV